MPLYVLNPMVGIIEGFRQVLIRESAPDMGFLGLSMAATVFVWIIGWPLSKPCLNILRTRYSDARASQHSC